MLLRIGLYGGLALALGLMAFAAMDPSVLYAVRHVNVSCAPTNLTWHLYAPLCRGEIASFTASPVYLVPILLLIWIVMRRRWQKKTDTENQS